MTRRTFLTAIGVPIMGTTVPVVGMTIRDVPVSAETWRRTAAEELAHPTPFPTLQHQPRVVDLAIGTFNATELESMEGYFSIGTGAALVLNQSGVPIERAREQIGTTGTLMWVRD